ncbi:unnamed protein product [Cuscuta campestris]|uniref:Uncharacterized protein n=1 Tax=Cuscuta campestris TaxID=132261 RepID=A0A484NQ65_9ASTE|nr:unnamed protein product [Cuscuta campestris]
MEALFQEFIATSNDFVYNHHSNNPVDSQMRFLNTNHLLQMKKPPAHHQPQETGEEEGDYPATTLKYISQMLMEEEDLETQPCMFRDCMALQATEKYFSDALNGTAAGVIPLPPPEGFSWTSSLTNSSSSSDEPSFDLSPPVANGSPEGKGKRNHNSTSSSSENDQEPRNKQLASYSDESEVAFDDLFPCTRKDPKSEQPSQQSEQSKGGRGRGRRGKKKTKQEFVDFRSLLTQCANSMANQEIRTAMGTLQKIRQHATPQGNGIERVAFYLANALDARLNGAGTSLYTSHLPGNTSAADVLKAYQMYIAASPFKTASAMMANKYIGKLAATRGAARLHIIDFGILYGFQWACLIQRLSARPGGPPRLRITGIDFPQPGFRPAERVNATGLRLEKYCRKFNVPFEFNAIAKKWETVELAELRLDRDDDVVIVNCLDRLGNVPDETVVPDSPRDTVLSLIKHINPDVFVHGIVNGAHSAPYFPTRFRETLFHFSSLFDILEETVAREDGDRRLFEEMVFGREALNVIACEGTERVERPETYKQWQVRSIRAGFRPLPLDQEIVECVREKVKSEYNKNFSVDEDGNWLLQGWKGKVLHAVSYWKPSSN